jgi:hypothetical protein
MNSTTLDLVQGFLLAFQQLNAGLDHAPTYALGEVPSRGDPARSVAAYLGSSPEPGGGTWHVEVQPLAEGMEALRPLLVRWLFDNHLGLPAGHEPEIWQAKQENCVNTLLSLLQDLCGGQPPRVWKVEARPPEGTFYDLVWDDFLLESGDRLFLLHLGMSD